MPTAINKPPSTANLLDRIVYVTPTGKVVKSDERFSSPASNWNCYKRLYDEDRDNGRMHNRAQVMKLRDGWPILSQAKLQGDGQGWRANHNNMTAFTVHNQHAAALWALEFNVENFIRVKLMDPEKAKAEQVDMRAMCGVIAEEYTRTMKAWPDLYYEQMMVASDEVTFGIGYPVWFDELDFRTETVPHGFVKVPPTTRASIEAYKVVYIERDMQVVDLLNIVDNPAAKDMGWDTKAIIRLLIRRYYEGKPDRADKYSNEEWATVLSRLTNIDDNVSDLDTVQLVHCFVEDPAQAGKEPSVSQYVFEAVEAADERVYLCERHGKRKDVTQVFCPYFYNVGNGYIRGIRGALQMLYPQLVNSLKMELGLMDAAVLSATVLLEDGGSNDLRTIKLGPIARLPAGSVPVQRSFTPNLEGLVSVYGLMDKQMNEHAGIYSQMVGSNLSGGDRRTAEEVRTQTEKEGTLTSFQTMIQNTHRDRYHRECLRRLLTNKRQGWKGFEESEAFRQRCTKRGVPEWMLDPKELDVQAERAFGYGSASMARMAMERLVGAVKEGMEYDQDGIKAIVRDFTALTAGWEHVDDYAPRTDRDTTPSAETSFAQLENDAIADGKQVVYGENQNHLVHAQMPIAMLMQLAQAYEAGKKGQGQPLDPRRLIPAFVVGLPHIQAHLSQLGSQAGSKNRVQPLYQAYKELNAVANRMVNDARAIAEQEQKAAIEAAQQAQPEMAARDPVLRLEARKDAVAQADIQRNNAVAAAEIQRKSAKAEVDMKAKMMKTMASVQDRMNPGQGAPVVPSIPPMQEIPMLEGEQGIV